MRNQYNPNANTPQNDRPHFKKRTVMFLAVFVLITFMLDDDAKNGSKRRRHPSSVKKKSRVIKELRREVAQLKFAIRVLSQNADPKTKTRVESILRGDN